MNDCFIILAAGQSKRFKSKEQKQYIIYKNKPVFEHSLEKVLKLKLFKHIILVTNNSSHVQSKYFSKIKIIKGGKERSDSSLKALKYIKRFKVKNVLIHDAARPDFSTKLVKKILLKLKKYKAVVPFTLSTDAIKYKHKKLTFNLNKNNTFLTQTPQGFKYKDLYKISITNKNKVADEASLFIKNNNQIKFIKGELNNKKITYKKDIKNTKIFFGIGFDVHRLVKGRKLYFGRIKNKIITWNIGSF